MGTWPFRLGESLMRQWSMVTWLHCKLQTRPLVREGAPQKQDRKLQTNISTGSNIWSLFPQGCSMPRHTDSLTVSRKVTSTSTEAQFVKGPRFWKAYRLRNQSLWQWVNAVAEERGELEAVTRGLVKHSTLRRLSACCRELQSVWNSESAYGYEL
jgi:hypothetical protein